MGAQVMKKLVQYDLDFDQTERYFQKYLDQRNSLSNALKKNIDFSKGHFYTLLTEDADISRLYEFEIGHILPPNPIEDIYVSSLKKTFKGQRINSIKNEFSTYLYEKIKSCHLACLMEDLIQSPTDPHVHLYHQIGRRFGEEVFYLITQKNLTKNLIKKSVKECSGWDFVAAVFTMNNFDLKNQEIKENDFSLICFNTSMVIISAYDAEGYLIWEKT